jgi:hypothetical protein
MLIWFQMTVCNALQMPMSSIIKQKMQSMQSWYSKKIQPYVNTLKSAWKRTPEIVESYQPFMPEEGYEVARKPAYESYRKMPTKGLQFIYNKTQETAKPLIQTYKPRIQQATRTFGNFVQQMIERDLSLDRIKEHYKDINNASSILNKTFDRDSRSCN